jgi:hypothetical protein
MRPLSTVPDVHYDRMTDSHTPTDDARRFRTTSNFSNLIGRQLVLNIRFASLRIQVAATAREHSPYVLGMSDPFEIVDMAVTRIRILVIDFQATIRFWFWDKGIRDDRMNPPAVSLSVQHP